MASALLTPSWVRYDANNPPKFTWSLNFVFAFAACFTVANLYYSQPILAVLAKDFAVSDYDASVIPAVAQAGYAGGLILICPLGDFLRRRPLALSTLFVSATLWIGLCVTTSYRAFLALTFLTGLTTVTPQIMMPLVGALAPKHRLATSLSIVVSGLILGVLVARILSGIVTEYTSWRNIYWLAFAVQYTVLILLYLFMPDYPAVNTTGLSYPKALWSIVTITIRSPVLIQSCIVAFLNQAAFTSFWTTLTFLLSSPPYNYSTLVIGLFALIGIASMLLGPLNSRLFIDKMNSIASAFIGEILLLIGICIGTYTGTFTVAGPVIQAFALDLGLQTSQIALQGSIYSRHPAARSRVNTSFMLSAFCGQLFGTAVGNLVYESAGWIRSGSMSVGLVGGTLLVLLARGPYETGWVGWHGGWGIWKKDVAPNAPDAGKGGNAKKEVKEAEEEEGKEGDVEKNAAGAELGQESETSEEEKTRSNSETNGHTHKHELETNSVAEMQDTERALGDEDK